jgi:vesicle-associated membrane protein 7
MTSSDENQIIYALVSRGSDVLAEFTDRTGNFEQVTRQLLNRIPPENKIMSYVYPKEKYVFHYIVNDGITFLCMADEGFGRMVPFRFLEDLKNKFLTSFGDRARSAHAFAFNADFQGVIRRLMDQANDPRNKTYRSTDSKIYEINEEIENTKNTVMQSIEKVLDRGETLELLVHKSDNLNRNALKFNKHSKKLKNRMLWKNVKMTLMLFFIILILIYFIVAMICGFDFGKC